jgi:hypothetical protein
VKPLAHFARIPIRVDAKSIGLNEKYVPPGWWRKVLIFDAAINWLDIRR